jgi:hypothetical protein
MKRSSGPLPLIVKSFLDRRRINYVRDDAAADPLPPSKTSLGRAMQGLTAIRSPSVVHSDFKSFRKIVDNSAPFLQGKFRELLFPVFVHLSLQFLRQRMEPEFEAFVAKFRSEFSHPSEGDLIDDLLESRGRPQPQTFTVVLDKAVYAHLRQVLQAGGCQLIPHIIESCITIHPPFLKPWEPDDGEKAASERLFTKRIYGPPSGPRITPAAPPEPVVVDQPVVDADIERLPIPAVAHLTIYNHAHSISDARLSKSLRLLAVAQNSTVALHAVGRHTRFPGGHPQCDLLRHGSRVLRVCFSPNDCLVASASLDNELRVAHTEVCREVCHFEFHTRPIVDLTFDQHSHFLCAASLDRTISLWTIGERQVLRLFLGHTQPVYSVAFAPGGESIFSVSTDQVVKHWDIRNGQAIHNIRFDGAARPTVIRAHPTSQEIVVCGFADGSLQWFDIAGETCDVKSIGDTAITDVQFTQDGDVILVAQTDGSLTICDILDRPRFVGTVRAEASTIDSIGISEYDLVMTVGQSTRGD